MENEMHWMARLATRDTAALAAIFVPLRQRVKETLQLRYQRLQPQHADLAAEAETLLLNWWRSAPALDRLRPEDSVRHLALRLVSQVARHSTRQLRHDRKVQLAMAEPADATPTAEADFLAAEELLDELERLPAKYGRLLRAEAAHQSGFAPEAWVVLGLSKEVYWQQLCRARSRLAARLARSEWENFNVG